MEGFKKLQQLISPKLTWQVFEDMLKKQSKSTNVTLLNIDFGEGIKKGDSYASTIIRFTVKYSGNSGEIFTLHVLSKVLIRNMVQRKTFRCDEFFKAEIYFYEKVWPALNAMQSALDDNEQFKDIPNYLCGYYDGTNDYILMEDLSYEKYKNVDRSVALNYEIATNVLSVFAHFHALGLALKVEKPQLFEQIASGLQENYFSERCRHWYEKFQKNLIEITLDAVKQELSNDYYVKIKEILSRDIFGATCKLYEVPTKYTAFTQGDAWIANFMVRFDENTNKLIDSKMIDFQLIRRASIAQDLHFFLNSCAEPDVLAQYFDEFLAFYVKEFNAFYVKLRKGKASADELMDIDELLKEFKSNGFFGLSMPMETILLSLFDEDELTDFDKLEGNEALPLEKVLIVRLLTVKEKRQRLAKFIKHMIDRKFI